MSGAGPAAAPFRNWVRRAAIRTVRSAPLKPIAKWNIVRGDSVVILAGRSAGKTGKVKSVLRRKNRVIVEGLNLVKRHVRASAGVPGGVISAESPLHVSNVNLVDPATGKSTRVGVRYTEEGERVRVAKRSGSVIPKPAEAKTRKRPRAADPGPRDTPAATALRQTYFPPAGLLPYLSRGGPLFTVRTDDAEKVPSIIRDGHVARKKDRNRIRAKWAGALERTRVSDAVDAARAGASSSAVDVAAAKPTSGGAELR